MLLRLQKVLSLLHVHLTCPYISFMILIKGKRNNPFLPFCTLSCECSDSCTFKLKMSRLQIATMQAVPGCPPPALLVRETQVALVQKSLGLRKEGTEMREGGS